MGASRAQRKAVLEVVERSQRRIARIAEEEARAILPVLHQAELELRRQLKDWIETRQDGELRWTAHSYHAALLQIQTSAHELEQMLLGRVNVALPKVQRLAVKHAIDQVAQLSMTFGEPRSISIDSLRAIATARSYIIPRIRSSAHRYAWGRGRASVAADMQRMLAVDIVKGAPLSETIDRLVRHGGPRGLVSLSGVKGEENAIVELIPEGLFARYRYWAERVVRTETTSAYGATGLEAMHEAAKAVPELKRQWFADGAACAHICQPMAGQVVGLDESFITPMGDAVMYGGAHPNCGCTAVPWKAGWPTL